MQKWSLMVSGQVGVHITDRSCDSDNVHCSYCSSLIQIQHKVQNIKVEDNAINKNGNEVKSQCGSEFGK